jgi:hypothetical protein
MYFRPDNTAYTNEAGKAGGHFAQVFVEPALLAWWAYAFAFPAKARRYFSDGPMVSNSATQRPAAAGR